MVYAGKLRHRINIECPVEVQDEDTGAVTVVWECFAESVAAEIAPLSVREFIAASSTQSEIVARIKIRFRDDLNAKMRIINKRTNEIYNPAGFLRDSKSGVEYLTIPVTQGVNDG